MYVRRSFQKGAASPGGARCPGIGLELKVMSSVYNTAPPNFSTISRSVLIQPVTIVFLGAVF